MVSGSCHSKALSFTNVVALCCRLKDEFGLCRTRHRSGRAVRDAMEAPMTGCAAADAPSLHYFFDHRM